MYNRVHTYGGIVWTSGQSDTLRENTLQVSVPSDLVFRRVYLAWLHYQAGDVFVEGKTRFLKNRAEVGSERFSWITGTTLLPVPDDALMSWIPAFTVNNRPAASGNSYPYEVPVTPDARLISFPYTEFGGGASYRAQITAQPWKVPVACDQVVIDFKCTSGTMGATSGAFVGFLKVDSMSVPF